MAVITLSLVLSTNLFRGRRKVITNGAEYNALKAKEPAQTLALEHTLKDNKTEQSAKKIPRAFIIDNDSFLIEALKNYNFYMEKSLVNKSNEDTTLGKNSEEELNRTRKNGVLLNGKTHSLSTEHTINKYPNSNEKQNPDFIEKIEKFPKYNTENDRGKAWEMQFLKGFSSEMSLNGSEINKTKKSSEAADQPDKGISVLRYKQEVPIKIE